MKLLMQRHTSREEVHKEKSRYSQSHQRDNSTDKFYTGMITSLNHTDCSKQANTKGYFRSIEPYCQQYLKLKHEVYRKYNEMRIRKKQEKQSKKRLTKNEENNSGKLQHLKQMDENINLLDFKYPCIGYYELKGYKKSKKQINCSLRGNKQNEIKNRLIKKNKTQENQLNTHSQSNYKMPLKQINHQNQNNNNQIYKFIHGNQTTTKSVSVIQNLLKKYETRKSMKKSKQNLVSGTLSQLTNYQGKFCFRTDQSYGSLLSIPVSQTTFQKIVNQDNDSKINKRQSHNLSCTNEQRSFKIIPLNPSKSINNRFYQAPKKIVYSIPRLKQYEELKKMKNITKNSVKSSNATHIQQIKYKNQNALQ